MNTIKGRKEKLNIQILLDSGCITKILIGRLVEKLHPGKYSVVQWHTQAGNATTNINIKVDFTLPTLSTTNIMT